MYFRLETNVFERSTGVELLLLLINFLKTRGGALISLFDAAVSLLLPEDLDIMLVLKVFTRTYSRYLLDLSAAVDSKDEVEAEPLLGLDLDVFTE